LTVKDFSIGSAIFFLFFVAASTHSSADSLDTLYKSKIDVNPYPELCHGNEKTPRDFCHHSIGRPRGYATGANQSLDKVDGCALYGRSGKAWEQKFQRLLSLYGSVKRFEMLGNWE